MVVFRDLLSYRWGIYHTEGHFEEMIGAHAVLIEGFGNQLGQEYWIVRNSWGPDWGER